MSIPSAEKLIVNIVKCFEQEKERGRLFKAIHRPLERAAYALHMTSRQVRYILEKNDPSLRAIRDSSTKKAHSKPKTTQSTQLKMDDFAVNFLQRKIQHMFNEKKVVTVKILQEILAKDLEINVSHTTVWKYLKDLGYKYKICILSYVKTETQKCVFVWKL